MATQMPLSTCPKRTVAQWLPPVLPSITVSTSGDCSRILAQVAPVDPMDDGPTRPRNSNLLILRLPL